jgi:hypothetical protein
MAIRKWRRPPLAAVVFWQAALSLVALAQSRAPRPLAAVCWTEDRPNSWICVDFKARRLAMTGYSLRTHWENGNGHIREWVVMASGDGSNWVKVDSRADDRLSEFGAQRVFMLSAQTAFYQYFKIEQTAKNTMGFDNLRLSEIEFFRTLRLS